MKSLTFLLLAFAIFQVSFSQDNTATNTAVEVEVVPETEAAPTPETEAVAVPASEAEAVTVPEAEAESMPETVLGGYTPVDLTTFQNDTEGQAALNFGAQYAVHQGIVSGILPNTSSWSVSQVNSVEEQVVAGINYRINATISNSVGDKFDALYVVYSQPSTNALEVLSLNYFYNEQNDGVVAANGAEYELNYVGGESLQVSEFNNGMAEPFMVGGYTELDPMFAAEDANIQALLDQGFLFAVQQGEDDGTLPNGDWELDTVNNVWEQKVAGTNYRFNVTADDGEQTFADLDYIVSQGLNGESEVASSAVTSVYSQP